MSDTPFTNPETQAEADDLETRLSDAEHREAVKHEHHHWSPMVGGDIDEDEADERAVSGESPPGAAES